jgi:hypothetical protein
MAPGASCEAAGGDFLPKHCAAFGRGGGAALIVGVGGIVGARGGVGG